MAEFEVLSERDSPMALLMSVSMILPSSGEGIGGVELAGQPKEIPLVCPAFLFRFTGRRRKTTCELQLPWVKC
jgi:hypothetical protein